MNNTAKNEEKQLTEEERKFLEKVEYREGMFFAKGDDPRWTVRVALIFRYLKDVLSSPL